MNLDMPNTGAYLRLLRNVLNPVQDLYLEYEVIFNHQETSESDTVKIPIER